METKLYRNVGGEEHPFLVLHISDESKFSDLEKFTGGKVEIGDSRNLIVLGRETRQLSTGDYVVFITAKEPFSRVRVRINRVLHHLPRDSYLICRPDEFNNNFEEITHG